MTVAASRGGFCAFIPVGAPLRAALLGVGRAGRRSVQNMSTTPAAALRPLHSVEGLTSASAWVAEPVGEEFDFRADAASIEVLPHARKSWRRVLRFAASFDVALAGFEFPELNLSMGRLHFEPNDTQPRTYRPFSRDDGRTLRAVFVGQDRPSGDEDVGFLNAVCDRFLGELVDRTAPRVRESFGGSENDEQRCRRAEHFERLHWHAHGWMNVCELQLLDWAARRAATLGGHALEIGSYSGRSTAAIAAALGGAGSEGLLVSIDPNELYAAQADVARANVSAVGELRRLVQINRSGAQVEALLADGCASFAFIDGLHEAPHVRADFRRCDRWLAPGGLLALHDVYPLRHLAYTPAHTGPAELIERVILPSGRYRPLAAAHLTFVLQKL